MKSVLSFLATPVLALTALAASVPAQYGLMMLNLTANASDPNADPGNTSSQRMNFATGMLARMSSEGEVGMAGNGCEIGASSIAETKSGSGGKPYVVTIARDWREKVSGMLCNSQDDCVINDAMVSILLHEFVHAMQRKFGVQSSEMDAYLVQKAFLTRLLIDDPKYAEGTVARTQMQKFFDHVCKHAASNPN